MNNYVIILLIFLHYTLPTASYTYTHLIACIYSFYKHILLNSKIPPIPGGKFETLIAISGEK